jgi:hypothetical protein
MSLPLSVSTQDQVLAAQVRNVLTNGGAWTNLVALTDSTGVDLASTPNTIANVTTVQEAENAIARLTAKVNAIIALLNNVNA